MTLLKHSVKTERRMQMLDITDEIQQDIHIKEGICIIYTPHTTCGVSVNENVDPAVCNDMMYGYERAFPTNDSFYHHAEGNSSAHMKSSAFGCSQAIIIHDSKLMLGKWQGIYLCEFDGPRDREYFVKIMEG